MRNARVEQHRHRTGLRPNWVEPCHRALAGQPADFLRPVKIGEVPRAVPGAVPLHRRTLARDDRGRAAEAGSGGRSRKAARRRKRDRRTGSARRRAAGILHPGNGERRRLRFERAPAKLGGIGLGRIDGVDRRKGRTRQQLGRRKSRERVFGRFPGHRQRPRDELCECIVRQV